MPALTDPVHPVRPDSIESDLASLVPIKQVEAICGVGEATVRNWARIGARGADGRLHKLPRVRLGKRSYVPREGLAQFLSAVIRPHATA
jgi:hypothetical protein